MALVLAFMHLYSIFNLQFFLNYNFLNLELKHQVKMVNSTSIS